MKKMAMRVLPVILCMAAAGPAYGAQWRTGAEENAGRLYVNADGAWTVDGIIQTRQIKSVNDNSDDQSWEDFQNEDDEDEEDSSEKKSSSEPTFDSSSEENSTPQGPALESDSSSSGNGDEKPDYEYPTETPDSSYKHSSAE